MDSIIFLREKSLMMFQWESVLKKLLPNNDIISANIGEYELLSETIKSTLVIVDIAPAIDPLEIIDYYNRRGTKVAVLLTDKDEKLLKQLFRLNLAGYLSKDMELQDIRLALDMMLNGEIYIHPKLSQVFLSDYIRLTNNNNTRPNDILTEREWEILELIVEGKQTKEMGEKLYISSKTVANHISSIYRKLNVRDRVGAVIFAVKEGWFVL
ncbi:MAG TPA: response regulator transcription factor [Bacillota bacterium]|nr:response regulator transcription factor [Bacillota bacterium]